MSVNFHKLVFCSQLTKAMIYCAKIDTVLIICKPVGSQSNPYQFVKFHMIVLQINLGFLLLYHEVLLNLPFSF